MSQPTVRQRVVEMEDSVEDSGANGNGDNGNGKDVATPLPEVGTPLFVSLGVGFVFLAGFFLWLFDIWPFDDVSRSEKVIDLGYLFLFASVLAVVWSAVISAVATIWPRREPTKSSLRGLALPDLGAIVTSIGGAPKWVGLAVVGVGLIIFGMMLDGYRFADGGLTSAPAAPESTPTLTPSP